MKLNIVPTFHQSCLGWNWKQLNHKSETMIKPWWDSARHFRHSTHPNRRRISTIFHLSPFNCHSVALKKELTQKIQTCFVLAFFLAIYVFGSVVEIEENCDTPWKVPTLQCTPRHLLQRAGHFSGRKTSSVQIIEWNSIDNLQASHFMVISFTVLTNPRCF